MPRLFNVVLNSFNCTTETVANPNTNKSYYIDWSARLPLGEYRLSFTFQSEGDIIHLINSIPVLYSDIVSSSSNTILPQSTVYSNTQILGTLFPTMLDPNAHICYLRGSRESNPPIYLNNRPFNNLFSVQIYNNDLVPSLWVDEASPTPEPIAPYILILHFELLKQYDLN